jgi:hypothetical protein
MEGSDATTPTEPEPQVGVSGEDIAAQNADQEPVGTEDAHGSITPTSPPDPRALSGNPLDPSTQAAIAGNVPAQGGPTAVPGQSQPEVASGGAQVEQPAGDDLEAEKATGTPAEGTTPSA